MSFNDHLQELVKQAAEVLEHATPEVEDVLEAQRKIEFVMGHDKDNMGLAFLMGAVYMRLQRWVIAEHWMRFVLEREPNMMEALNNLGFIMEQQNDRAGSVKLFEDALALDPDNPILLNNVATAKVCNGTPDEAIAICDKAIAAKPDFADAHWNRSLALLEKGLWREGWKEHEWGLKLTTTSSQSRKIRHYGEEGKVPWWDGTKGQSVVVYSEQGVGDEIMAASMLPDAARDANITFESHPRLVNLMRHAFGDQFAIYGTRKMPWQTLAFPEWTPIDAKAAIFDLAKFYRNEDSDFPRVAYLKPFDEQRERFEQELSLHGERPKIGISWQGGGATTRQDLRTIPLYQWRHMLKDIDATWVSLQYDPADAVGTWAPIVDAFNKDLGLNILHWEDDINDLDACYGGLIHELDLIISVNTSLVHACGAMGVECWTLTPNKPAWRYGLSGDHMPFYGPWVHQYRQADEPWEDVIGRAHADLAVWSGKRTEAA